MEQAVSAFQEIRQRDDCVEGFSEQYRRMRYGGIDEDSQMCNKG